MLRLYFFYLAWQAITVLFYVLAVMAFEKAAKRGCCSSYKLCQSEKTSANKCISKDKHQHSECKGCLDIPVVYIGTLTTGYSNTEVQHQALDAGSSLPALHINHPEEKLLYLPAKHVLPENTARHLITTIVLLIWFTPLFSISKNIRSYYRPDTLELSLVQIYRRKHEGESAILYHVRDVPLDTASMGGPAPRRDHLAAGPINGDAV